MARPKKQTLIKKTSPAKAKKTVKRRKDAPVVPHSKRPPEPKATRQTKLSRQRARLQAVLARTAASRAELDGKMAGADMRSLDHLQVVVFPLGRPKVPGLAAKLRGEDEGTGFDGESREVPPRSPMPPPDPRVLEMLNRKPDPITEAMAIVATDADAHPLVNHPLPPTRSPRPSKPRAPKTFSPGKPGGHRCGTCGRKGHNTRTCDTAYVEARTATAVPADAPPG